MATSTTMVLPKDKPHPAKLLDQRIADAMQRVGTVSRLSVADQWKFIDQVKPLLRCIFEDRDLVQYKDGTASHDDMRIELAECLFGLAKLGCWDIKLETLSESPINIGARPKMRAEATMQLGSVSKTVTGFRVGVEAMTVYHALRELHHIVQLYMVSHGLVGRVE